jgi:hypothetical protein
MTDRIIAVLVAVLFGSGSTAFGQFNMNTVSANVGTIRTMWPDQSVFEEYQYTLYYELQIGGLFFAPSFKWVAYWGHWDDGIARALPVADLATHSNSGHVIGARVFVLPTELLAHWPLPVGVFAGASHEFLSIRYVGGHDYYGRPANDYTEDVTTLEIGLNVEVEILSPLAIRGEIRQLFPLGDQEVDQRQKGRRAYTIGVAAIL